MPKTFNTEQEMNRIRQEIKLENPSVSDQYLLSKYYEERVRKLKNKSIIIVGAGDYGQTLEFLLEKEGCKVEAFADNSSFLQGSSIRGLLVLSVGDAAKLYPHHTFVITPWLYETDLLWQLGENHILPNQIVIVDLNKCGWR